MKRAIVGALMLPIGAVAGVAAARPEWNTADFIVIAAVAVFLWCAWPLLSITDDPYYGRVDQELDEQEQK